MRLMINGEPREVLEGLTLAGLLGELGLDPRMVVVEHNRTIVRRPMLAEVKVAEGDAVELVHFVGGG
ncbi:MAG TPA: sulfur carrier protein ThiS [Gemmatimonadales bacterium]|nr:sulfur carrier protein ThiS [Gemmatimonadales bacterium]